MIRLYQQISIFVFEQGKQKRGGEEKVSQRRERRARASECCGLARRAGERKVPRRGKKQKERKPQVVEGRRNGWERAPLRNLRADC